MSRGSSPRMRGTQRAPQPEPYPSGLIPTYAGNTVFAESRGRFWRAHPHVCGEHGRSACMSGKVSGSSPRMRGTRRRTASVPSWGGLIPTYAGNTTRCMSRAALSGAHPHVCGEHRLVAFLHPRHEGSSPRMRGTHPLNASERILMGLIPTYAGNTLRCRNRRSR